MADEAIDMEYADIRAALTGASTEKAPATPPAAETVEETVETPPAETEGEKAPEGEVKPPAPEDKREKRFSKLTKERDAERNARIALETRLAALEAAQKAPAIPAHADTTGEPEAPDADKYGTWNEYQAALAKHNRDVIAWNVKNALAQKEQEQELVRRKADYDRVQSGWQKQVEDLTEDNDDLEDAIKTVGESVAKKGIIDVIKESEVGGKMVLYLHRNPDELKKVEGMSIASAARYLGKIEARLEGEAAAPVTSAAKPAVKLPKPPAQVGGSPAGAAKGFDYQKASDEDFKAQAIRDGLPFRRR